MERIVATLTSCEQVGENSFRDVHVSRVFSTDRSLRDILSWAETMLGQEPVGIGQVLLSEYTGESS